MSQNSNDSSSNAKPNPWQSYTFDGEKTGTMPSVTRLLNRKSLKRDVSVESSDVSNNQPNLNATSDSFPSPVSLVESLSSLPPPPDPSLDQSAMPPLPPQSLDLKTAFSDIPPPPKPDVAMPKSMPPPPPKSDGTHFTKVHLPPPPPSNPTMAKGEFTRVVESAKNLSSDSYGKNAISSLGHRSFVVWNKENLSKSTFRVEKEFSKKTHESNEILVLLKWVESATNGEKCLEPKCVFTSTETLRFFDGFSMPESVFSKYIKSYNPIFAAFQSSDLTQDETGLFLAAFGLNTVQIGNMVTSFGRLISSTEQDGHIYIHVSASPDRTWLDRALAPAEAS